MGRTVARRATAAPASLSPTALASKAIAFLMLSSESKSAKDRADVIKSELMVHLADHGEPDERGHRYFYFANPITAAGKAYKGVKRERRVSRLFDEEAAEQILSSHGLLEEATEVITTTRIDQDKVYILNQEGRISDEELDAMFSENETYAFKPEAA